MNNVCVYVCCLQLDPAKVRARSDVVVVHVGHSFQLKLMSVCTQRDAMRHCRIAGRSASRSSGVVRAGVGRAWCAV